MLNIDPHMQWLFFLLPVFLYAEIHYRIWNVFSRYFKREPEIVADLPHRIGPGQKLPVFLCIKDAHRFPVDLDFVKIQIIKNSHEVTLYEKNFADQKIVESFWYELYQCDVDWIGDVNINVVVSYSCRGRKKQCVNDNYKLTSHEPFTLFVDDSPRPTMPGWVFGDMHTHSHLSSDQVEFGAPFEVTAAMARASELDFFASSDHSYDLDDRIDDYLRNDPDLPKWKQMWHDIEELNAKNKHLVIIPGEELSAGNEKNQNVHYLIFNNKNFWPGWGDSAETWFRTTPQHRIADVLPHLDKGAVSFAAHPVVEPPLVQKWLIRRGIWTDNDLTLPGLHGAQFWNGDKEHFLKVGLKKWTRLLLAGHKITLIAGTDAHGSFNRFRQIGTPHVSMREEQHEIFGTSVTGVFIKGELSLESILDGLKKGRVMVTDGPIAAISCQPSAISREEDDKRQTTEVFNQKAENDVRPTTSDYLFHIGDTIALPPSTIMVSAVSTPSYGELHRIEIVLGNISTKKETRKPLTVPSGSFHFVDIVTLDSAPQPGYIRLEVESRIGDRSFHGFTNPIFFA